MEAILFVGIQAGGKSTLYRRRFVDTHIRVNLDMLKTRHRERLIFQACIEAKQPVVIDNTNLTAVERARYIAPAKAAGFHIVGYYFRSTVSDALRRNRERTAGRMIPEIGIFSAYHRLELPRREEGFDVLYYVTIGLDNEFSVEDWRDDL